MKHSSLTSWITSLTLQERDNYPTATQACLFDSFTSVTSFSDEIHFQQFQNCCLCKTEYVFLRFNFKQIWFVAAVVTTALNLGYNQIDSVSQLSEYIIWLAESILFFQLEGRETHVCDLSCLHVWTMHRMQSNECFATIKYNVLLYFLNYDNCLHIEV